MKYVVVENSGHEGEYTWPGRFTTIEKAERFIRFHYGSTERHRLHVQIAVCNGDGTLSYEW